MTDPSVCFLGCGSINTRHIRTLKRLRPRARIAVASRDGDRARAFADRHGVNDCFGRYEDAFASEYRAVVIGVPPSAHRALLEMALDAGKHVLIESPVLASFEELEQLWPRLVSHAATVMVAENLHYAPFHRRLKQLLGGPGLGRPLLLDLTRLGHAPPTGWRADPQEMPLGALHERGVHWIRRLLDLASVFEDGSADHVVEVHAIAPPAPVTATPGEDTMMIVARHRSGLMSRLFHSWALPWRFWPFEASKVLLEHGAMYFDARGIIGRFYGPSGRRWVGPHLGDAAGFQTMWRDFLACIDGSGQRPELTLEQVFADFAYMDAAYRSLGSGRPEAPVAPVMPRQSG
jgi:predicted dehydrogenase